MPAVVEPQILLIAAASKAEEEANQKRWKESGGGLGPMDQWSVKQARIVLLLHSESYMHAQLQTAIHDQ